MKVRTTDSAMAYSQQNFIRPGHGNRNVLNLGSAHGPAQSSEGFHSRSIRNLCGPCPTEIQIVLAATFSTIQDFNVLKPGTKCYSLTVACNCVLNASKTFPCDAFTSASVSVFSAER